jgi:hypothetical protein
VELENPLDSLGCFASNSICVLLLGARKPKVSWEKIPSSYCSLIYNKDDSLQNIDMQQHEPHLQNTTLAAMSTPP